ncbi:hypothetical protein HAX54_030669, partial [Datura stramonium]|nr:hypothetical protein [Datura stramonium]
MATNNDQFIQAMLSGHEITSISNESLDPTAKHTELNSLIIESLVVIGRWIEVFIAKFVKVLLFEPHGATILLGLGCCTSEGVEGAVLGYFSEGLLGYTHSLTIEVVKSGVSLVGCCTSIGRWKVLFVIGIATFVVNLL